MGQAGCRRQVGLQISLTLLCGISLENIQEVDIKPHPISPGEGDEICDVNSRRHGSRAFAIYRKVTEHPFSVVCLLVNHLIIHEYFPRNGGSS